MTVRAVATLLLATIVLAACQPANIPNDAYASGNVNPVSGNRAGTGEASGH